MNSTQEANIRSIVKSALCKLTDGRVWTRDALFGKGNGSDYDRSRRVLSKLVDSGLIHGGSATASGAPKRFGEPLLYQAKDAGRLTTIANDEVELTHLIWPSRAPGISIELRHAIETINTIEPGSVAASQFERSAGSDADAPTLDQKIDAALKLLMALTENVLYLREKVDDLNSVACSHCTEPGKHQ